MAEQNLIKQRIEDSETIARFTKLIGAVRKVSPEAAASAYELEKFHFMKELGEKSLQDCSPISSLGVFLDVVSNGLSFSSGQKLVYLMARNVKLGDGYEKRLVWSPSPDGKIYQCQRAGSIDHVTKPIMVYEGDSISIGNKDGMQFVNHESRIPRLKEAKLIGGYVYTVYKNGAREAFWMDMNDVERLKGYSIKNNRSNGANALYASGPNGTIDVGFFGAKLISHALKNVRKNTIASAHEVDADEADYYEVKDQQPEPQAQLSEPIAQKANNIPNDIEDLF